MGQPTVIDIPALSGIGKNIGIQIPYTQGSAITIVNLNSLLGLTLCNDSTFETTWPLPANSVYPQTGVDQIWVQNPNNEDIQLLILQGIVPVTLASSPINYPPPGNLPYGAKPITAGSGEITGGNATIFLQPPTGKTVYLTGYQVAIMPGTTAQDIGFAILNLIDGFIDIVVNVQTGSNAPTILIDHDFSYPIPANDINSAIELTCGVPNGGSTCVNAQGYYL